MDEHRAPDETQIFIKEAYNRWKQGQVTQKDYRGTVQAWSDGVRKTKVHLELNPERDVKRQQDVLLQVYQM